MPRHFQFSLRALLVATSLLAVGLTTLISIPLTIDFIQSVDVLGNGSLNVLTTAAAFQLCLVAAGASFGAALGIILRYPKTCAATGAVVLSLCGWAWAFATVDVWMMKWSKLS